MGCTKRVGLFRGNNIYSNRKKTVSRSKDNKDGWTRSEEGGRVSSGQIKRGDLQQVNKVTAFVVLVLGKLWVRG